MEGRKGFGATAEQQAILRAGDGVRTVQEMAAALGVCESSARRYAACLGVTLRAAMRMWTPAEDESLRSLAGLGSLGLSKALGRSRKGVIMRASTLGIHIGDPKRFEAAAARLPIRRWTPAEDAAIRERANLGTGALVLELGRTVFAVRRRANYLGVQIAYLRANMAGPARVMRPWTDADDAVIRARASEPSEVIAAVLGRSPGSVRHRAWRLGVSLRAKGGRRPVERFVRIRSSREVAMRPARVRDAGHAVSTVVRQIEVRPARYETKAAAMLARAHGIRPGMPSLIEYCRCGSPVWDWAKHHERQGHRRETHLAGRAS